MYNNWQVVSYRDDSFIHSLIHVIVLVTHFERFVSYIVVIVDFLAPESVVPSESSFMLLLNCSPAIR